MKNLSALAFLTLLLVAGTSFSAAARIRRVNNTGVAAVATILYTDFATAHTAAQAGDTIQIEPSGVSYGSLTCSKRLIVLGPGYFLGTSLNAGLQANPSSATFNDFSPLPGSENMVVAGLTINTVYLQTDNTTIQRCYITSYLYFYAASHTSNNCNIRQNYIGNMANYYNNYGASNLLITNNIFANSVSLPASYNGEFSNNVVLGSTSFDNFNVTNNYFAGSFATGSNIHSYNATAQSAASQPAFTAANNSQTNVSTSAAFALTPGATQFDAWYLLKAGTNPLRATGQNGTDIGAFGGNAPYKLSGLPAIPSIYQYTQSVNGNTLNVNMSTRSNN